MLFPITIFGSEGLGLQTANKKVLLCRVHIGFIDTPTFVLGRVLIFTFNSYLHWIMPDFHEISEYGCCLLKLFDK